MASFTKVNDFVEDLAEGVHGNLATASLVLALSNTAPASETNDPTADGNGQLSNVTQIAYTFLSSRALTVSSSAQTGGTYTLTLNDVILTATGGTAATFRYIYIYNDTAANDELIGVYDYGSDVTIADGQQLTIDWGADGGTTGALFTLT